VVLTSVLDTLVSVPVWLLLTLVFLFPALEASVFLGLVVPGETMVVLGGVAAQGGRVPLVAVIVAAILGAVIGDQVGFHVGRRYGSRLVGRMPAETRRGQHLGSALTFVRRRGPIAVTFGRWTASLRSLVPGIAGMSGMGQRSFTAANVVGGVVWATVVAVAGYLAGKSYRALENNLGLAANIMLGLTVGVVLVFWLRTVLRHRRELREPAPATPATAVEAESHIVPEAH
jgi:membrane-associated protein